MTTKTRERQWVPCACSVAVAGGVLAAVVAAQGVGSSILDVRAWLAAEVMIWTGIAWTSRHSKHAAWLRAWQCSMLARHALTLLRVVVAHTGSLAWAAALAAQVALLLVQCVAVPAAAPCVPFGACCLCGTIAVGAYLGTAFVSVTRGSFLLPHAVLQSLGNDGAAWAGFTCRCLLDTLVATLFTCRAAGYSARQHAACERAMAVSRQSALQHNSMSSK